MPPFDAARPVRATLAGARDASAVEHSGFGLVASYGITLGVARAVSHLHDQRRPVLRKRRLRRRITNTLSDGGHLRVHHYVPGIAIAFTSGAVAILRSHDDLGFCLSLVFGTGAGLTFDEILVLLERPTSYWAHQNVAVASMRRRRARSRSACRPVSSPGMPAHRTRLSALAALAYD